MNAHYTGNCLEILPQMTASEGHVDLIIYDGPYGMTNNKWDRVLETERLWPEFWRLGKPNAAVVVFGQGKYSAQMIMSDPNYRYTLIWKKGNRVTGFLQAKGQPLRNHEDMLIFYKRQPTYNPQMTEGEKPSNGQGRDKHSQPDLFFSHTEIKKLTNRNYRNNLKVTQPSKSKMKYPRSIWDFAKPHPAIHPTQKPVELIAELIKTFTNPGDTVLDPTSGSGTTARAAELTGRNSITIEIQP